MSQQLVTTNSHVVVLNEDIIKKYICPNATQQEIYMFLQLCKAQNLNPFLREAYLIKYGTAPATQVIGKDTFLKRARSITAYRGFKAGVTVISNKSVVYREGGIIIPGEELIGGWAEVYRSDTDVPNRSEVAFSEYVAKKSDGTINQQWTNKPATMIRKVAVAQAHREAFPDQFEGMYSPEEMGVEVDDIEYKTDKTAAGYKPPVDPPQEKQSEPTGETLTVNFIPKGVSQTEGVNKTTKKPFKKFIIEGPDGEYNTFSETFAKIAAAAAQTGELICVTYKVSKFGNDIVTVGEAVYESAEG
jgi:phage recombination protein Bet